MRRNKSTFSFMFISLLWLVACQTSKSKQGGKEQEALSGKDLRDDKDRLNEELTDPVSRGEDSAVMWSPSNRRAQAMYHFLIAQKSLLRADYKQAEENLENAYNLEPNSYVGGQLVRSKLMSSPGNSEAQTEARRMTLLYPNDANMRLLFGQALIFSKEYREAEIEFRKAIELDGQLAGAYQALIKLLQIQNKTDKAIAVAKAFTAAIPFQAESWDSYSRLLIATKRYKEALVPAKKAWELQENNLEYALIYALVLDMNDRGKEAVKYYEQLYRFNPGNSDLVQRMIALYKDIGNLSNALSLIDDMIENSREEVPGLKIQKILILWEMARDDEALKVARELESELPESDRVCFMSGIAHRRVGLKEEAIRKLDKIQPESPLKLDALRIQVSILLELEKLKEAVALAKVMSELSDSDPVGFLMWSDILSMERNYAEAIAVIDKGLEKHPNNERLLFNKGAYFERSGDKQSSEKIMRSLIELNPKHAAALNYLGYMFADDNRNLDEAESLILRAVAIEPNNGGYQDSLGWVLYRKQQFQKALKILEKASKLDPKEGLIFEHIGDTLLALGESARAKAQYAEALKRDLEKIDQERIQRKFDALK